MTKERRQEIHRRLADGWPMSMVVTTEEVLTLIGDDALTQWRREKAALHATLLGRGLFLASGGEA